MKIFDGIYAYIWRGVFENNCNMFYFGDPLNILFDPGLTRYIDLRFEDMKRDGIDIEDIKYIANTHSHPDHFEGSEYFRERGVPIVIYNDEIDFINEIGPVIFKMLGIQLPSLSFDKILQEGEWKVGDISLEVYHTPGHSPGSMCIYWPEKKALICGDLIFKESVGRVDFPGGDAVLLKNSIEKIRNLDIEILLPGHMDYIIGKEAIIRNFEFISHYITMI
ncbi:MAG: MBL fold metallo-hydrolase [Spirochaetota bacterium]|nr:MBL fold metallo-hydrolase [Spirochaetota bacterium]